MKSTSKKRTPSIVNLTVKRRYLTQREVERLMDCARKYGRYGHRDATMILVAYRHGLRASEVCDLQWQQIELSEGRLHVHRVKNGIASVHPIRGDEIRALRKLRRDYPRDAYVFVSERGGPIGPIGFHRLIQRIGKAAKMPFPIHPHMLRHACGFKLANDGHDTRALQHYLGHKNIQHTVRYTELAPDRFKDFWRDWPPCAGQGGDILRLMSRTITASPGSRDAERSLRAGFGLDRHARRATGQTGERIAGLARHRSR